jgi:hypothetical protein
MSRTRRKPNADGSPKHPTKVRREIDVEGYLCDVVTFQGGTAAKFVSPSFRSRPDRICMRPIPPEHRAIVARYLKFVEAKAPGEHASESQAREHKRLRDLGFEVHVIDTPDGVDRVFYDPFDPTFFPPKKG